MALTDYFSTLQSCLKRLRLEGNRISESEIGYALSIWQKRTDFTLGLAPQLVHGQKFNGLLALCRGKTEYFEADLGQVPSEVAVPLPHVSSRACCLLALPVHAGLSDLPLMHSFHSPW